MITSDYPSTVVLPDTGRPCPSILSFLAERFPTVDKRVWETRIASGKVITENGDPITPDTPYVPLTRLRYFREVAAEPRIPFTEKILFLNDELLVACKPHFLPVIPAGPYVNECLLHRLRKKTGNPDLVPINRIDRETAGLVLFSMNPATRGRYHDLFMKGAVKKTYQALAHYPGDLDQTALTLENRIEKGRPWFRMKTAPGAINAITHITLIRSAGNRALFELCPVTGKKHQLRLHLSGLGCPILNDRLYPDLLPKKTDTFNAPLQLVARRLRFTDPVSGKPVTYESDRQLSLAAHFPDTRV
ncbi:MAG: pseudouridine synthase [Deltaproteobacteria bacterium]|nr:MAG: pseudouridine synthase [Deltaproteobacteria bacterium]